MAAIKTVGVVGAGTMGAGIAQKIALEGGRVVLMDQGQPFLDKALRQMKAVFQEGCERKVLKAEEAEAALSRIRACVGLEAARECDLVIEAVYEDPAVKKDLFAKLDAACPKETIFATNTSSLSVAELSRFTKRADRFLGLHFFYHPVKNRLVEVIPIPETSPEALERLGLFAKSIGKVAIRVKDRPGFAVNRFFVPWLNEAVRMLDEGQADVATIEEAAKRSFGVGMGPFELMNATGVPIAHHAALGLSRGLGKFYAPAEGLGLQVDKKENWTMGSRPDPSRFDRVAERLWGTVFWVALCLVEEGTAAKEDVDRGAKLGLRWPKGPFEAMNDFGLDRSLEWVEKIAARYGLAVPESLPACVESGKAWDLRLVDLIETDGVARIILNRPEAMNALTVDLLRDLDRALDEVRKNASIRWIILEGAGKAFAAGADIKFFLRAMEACDFDAIESFTRLGHQVFRKLGDLPVVAKLEGPAVGGGAELAMACRFRVATEKARLAFPETGLGIYPGLGGTQRLARLIGKESAKYFIFTGAPISASLGLELGLIDLAISSEAPDRAILEALEAKAGPRKARPRPPEHVAACGKGFCPCLARKYFSDENAARLLQGSSPQSDGPFLEKVAQSLSRKAPVALRLANRIMDEGCKLSLDEGLKIELMCLKQVFRTRDAFEGLSSVGKKAPVFRGN